MIAADAEICSGFRRPRADEPLLARSTGGHGIFD